MWLHKCVKYKLWHYTICSIGGAIISSWETKTSAFNVEAGRGYFVDTSSSAITATLPASPTAGDTVRFIDLSATFDTNNLTVARNSKKIQMMLAT